MNQNEVEEVYNNEYFKINEVLLIATGLWPYRPRNEKLLFRITFSIIMSLVLFPNVNAVRIWCGIDFCLCGENIVACLYSIAVLSKYYSTIFSESRILKIHEQVAKNWISITNEDEKSILINYAKLGKIMSIVYIVYMSIAGLGFCQVAILPIVLDLILPLNESRPKILIVRGEYYFDPFKYYYQLYTGYFIAMVVSLAILMSIDTTYSAVVHQNLGILSIVKRRLHLATKYYGESENKDVAYDTVIEAISLHKEALKFVDLIESSYYITLLLIMGITILSLGLGGVIIAQYIGRNAFEAARMSMMAIGVLIHTFFLSYPGQLILDHTTDIFIHIYTSEWYSISHKAKKLLKIMMLRCMKISVLTAGKLYVMNYENYGNILKTSLSYVTVLASFQD